MISDFARAVFIADEEGYTNNVKGSYVLLEIFEHLAAGGTVNNMEGRSALEIVALLAVAWRDVRDLANCMPPDDWPV